MAELWLGTTPLVAANTYLRSNASWQIATIENKASRLKPLFEFLDDNAWSFFDIAVRRGGAAIHLYRNSMIARCIEDTENRITFGTVRALMLEAYHLCRFWIQPDEPPLHVGVEIGDSRGPFSHKAAVVERLPEVFKVTVAEDEPRRGNSVLLEEQVEACWRHVGADTLPVPPRILARSSRLVSTWPARRRASWLRARAAYAEQLAWHRRNQILWAVMLASGMRRGEVSLLMVRDVVMYRGELWVQLKRRAATRHLGKAKTGGRIMFIGFDSRVRVAWENWMLSRDVLVSKWMGRGNRPDHGMLFVNRNGGPLTGKGIMSLMRALNSRFKTFGDFAFFGDEGFALHPHALRHTIKTLMEEWGVPPESIQRHLGHKHRQTTEKYGKTYRTTYVAMLNQMESHFNAATNA